MFTLVFIILAAIAALIFSLPAQIPMVRHWAMTHRFRRWGVIGLLCLAVTLVNYLGWVWFTVKEEIIFSLIVDACFYGEENCNRIEFDPEQRILILNFELQDKFESELMLRRLFLNTTRECFTDNIEICEIASIWHTTHQWRRGYTDSRTLGDEIIQLMFIVISLLPSVLTGFLVYRITRDNRKQKRE
jgi:hypothetical protein